MLLKVAHTTSPACVYEVLLEPKETRRVVDRVLTEEGLKLAKVGLTGAQVYEYGSPWKARLLPFFVWALGLKCPSSVHGHVMVDVKASKDSSELSTVTLAMPAINARAASRVYLIIEALSDSLSLQGYLVSRSSVFSSLGLVAHPAHPARFYSSHGD